MTALRRSLIAAAILVPALLQPAASGHAAGVPPMPSGGFVDGLLPPPPGYTDTQNHSVEPGIAVDGGGTFWVGSDPTVYGDPRNATLRSGVLAGEDVWRSVDGGRTYQWVASPFSVLVSPGLGGDDADIAAAPQANAVGCYNVYAASLWVGSSAVAISQDCGATWTVDDLGGPVPDDDRPWIAADGACGFYLAYHAVTDVPIVNHYDVCDPTQTAMSSATPLMIDAANVDVTEGNTFGKIVVDTSAASAFAHNVYLPLQVAGSGGGTAIAVAVSRDGGRSFAVRTVAADADSNFEVWPATVATDSAGTVYTAWFDRAHTFLAASHDGGQTWLAPVQVDAAPIGGSAYPTAAAGGRGEVGVAFYGTARSGDPDSATAMGPASTAGSAVWNVWWAASHDGGQSFDLEQASGAVHTGQLCTTGDSCSSANSRNLFDDFGAAVDRRSGALSIAFTTDQPAGTLRQDQTGYASVPPVGRWAAAPEPSAGGGAAPTPRASHAPRPPGRVVMGSAGRVSLLDS